MATTYRNFVFEQFENSGTVLCVYWCFVQMLQENTLYEKCVCTYRIIDYGNTEKESYPSLCHRKSINPFHVSNPTNAY